MNICFIKIFWYKGVIYLGMRIDIPLRNLIVWHDNPRAAIEMSENEDEAIDILFEVEEKVK